MVEASQTKVCTTCQTEKQISEFPKQKNGRYGVRAQCKSCRAEYLRQYREDNKESISNNKRKYYQSNKEVIDNRSQQWRERNNDAIREYSSRYYEENKESIAEYKRQYYVENTESINEKNRRYNSENADVIAEYYRQWQKDNPDKCNSYVRNRRARINENGGSHTDADIKSLYEGQGGKCWYCGCDLGETYDVDHFIPISKGGSNDVGNLRIACTSCNRSKNASDPHKWSGRLL